MSENSTNIAVIGLGAMGLPMATAPGDRLLRHGVRPSSSARRQARRRTWHRGERPRLSGASKDAEIALLAVRDQGQAESASSARMGCSSP